MKKSMKMLRTGPAFYVRTEGGEMIWLSTVDAGGRETRYPETTVAELLLHRSELNFIPLRDEVARLWQEYPLDGYDRPRKDELVLLAKDVRAGAEVLRELDPLGYFFVTSQLDRCQSILNAALNSENIDFMEVGAFLLNSLEEPGRSQLPLRNMFEIAFDGMERATQRERYELLIRTYTDIYPPVVDRYYPVRRITASEGDVPLSGALEYRVETLDDLHHLLFSLYFAQKKQRIVRCECCWGYFIPPTTRPALYCTGSLTGSPANRSVPICAMPSNSAATPLSELTKRCAAG